MFIAKQYPGEVGKNPSLVHFYHVLMLLWEHGKDVKPRGLKSKEILNFAYTFPPRVRFMCFDHRKFKIDYAKQEFLWYLRGNRKDVSIAKIASMWSNLIKEDGTINSNYGWFLFNKEACLSSIHTSNFNRVIAELANDPDSRRATITILSNEYLNEKSSDYPCTYGLNFHIREDKLHMTVHMRSNDAIYGLANDAPAFSFTHELLWVSLLKYFPYLQLGSYHHIADSFHVYERHYDLVQKILSDPKVTWDEHGTCPHMSNRYGIDEMRTLTKNLAPVIEAKKQNKYDELAARWPILKDPFIKWLLLREDPKTLLEEEQR